MLAIEGGKLIRVLGRENNRERKGGLQAQTAWTQMCGRGHGDQSDHPDETNLSSPSIALLIV
jgi:hypothetical protein